MNAFTINRVDARIGIPVLATLWAMSTAGLLYVFAMTSSLI